MKKRTEEGGIRPTLAAGLSISDKEAQINRYRVVSVVLHKSYKR